MRLKSTLTKLERKMPKTESREQQKMTNVHPLPRCLSRLTASTKVKLAETTQYWLGQALDPPAATAAARRQKAWGNCAAQSLQAQHAWPAAGT